MPIGSATGGPAIQQQIVNPYQKRVDDNQQLKKSVVQQQAAESSRQLAQADRAQGPSKPQNAGKTPEDRAEKSASANPRQFRGVNLDITV